MFAFENPSYSYSFASHSVQHQYFLDFHFEEHIIVKNIWK